MNNYYLLLVILLIFVCFGGEEIQENQEKKVFYTKVDGLIRSLNIIINKDLNDSEFEINEKTPDEFDSIISKSKKDLSQSARVFFNSNLEVIEEIPLFESEEIIQNSDHNLEIDKESINLGSNKENTQNFINSVVSDNKVSKKSSTYDRFVKWFKQFCCNNNTQITNLEEIIYQQ